MYLGFIDGLTSGGVLEGWAYDKGKPLVPLLVAVNDDENEQVAAGFANLYRQDLADANCGLGWCYFRLQTKQNVNRIRQSRLRLIAVKTNKTICESKEVDYFETMTYAVYDLQAIIDSDPTVVSSLDQIEGIDEVFDRYIQAKGVDAFVRSAYLYVLGRSSDESGLTRYTSLVRQKRLSPYALLRTMAESAEFKTKPRKMIAPNEPGFPFRAFPHEF